MELKSIIAQMIPRRLKNTVKERLQQFPAVALMGPRQVGKTTLARHLTGVGETQHLDATHLDTSYLDTTYLDLENPADRAKLSDPRGYLATQADKLVIIDEVQRAPEIFQVLRGLIDERVLAAGNSSDGAGSTRDSGNGQFLLLGSASIDLLQQSSETLAGRIAYLELHPLDVLEIATAEATNSQSSPETSPETSLEASLWVRGGFPRSFLAASDSASAGVAC